MKKNLIKKGKHFKFVTITKILCYKNLDLIIDLTYQKWLSSKIDYSACGLFIWDLGARQKGVSLPRTATQHKITCIMKYIYALLVTYFTLI